LPIHGYIAVMQKAISNTVLSATGAQAIHSATVIQSLWSGYGEIVRLELEGGTCPSVILKHIKLPEAGNHPRGWNTGLSHDRKIRSYQVEAHWYKGYAHQCDSDCLVPGCLAVSVVENETILVLTDLDAAGFDVRKETVTLEDMLACLDWLASFHATFLNSPADGLWECGSYWHLDTRPDELAALEDVSLREAASLIDQQLRQCHYQTLVHGDAKLANFCFTDDTPKPGVAAVDFQYVGRGCGMKDVAYFVGSCLREDECEALEGPLLGHYFSRLGQHVTEKQPGVDITELEGEWRGLYDVAWADFHRFLKGWSPGHWKINSYSEQLTRRVIERLQS
jgi:ecdysteroid kinase